MSNPYKPNTVGVPNIIFDYWMAQLTDGEFKVLMAIARKTYGWHKQRDMISLKQIEEMTNLSRRGIIKIIDSLVERKIVIKTKSKTEDGDDAPNVYEINTECEEGVNADVGGREPSSLGVGNSVHHGGRELSAPTKDTINTKDTIQKNIARTASPPRPNVPDISFSFDKNKFENVTPEDIATWSQLYPAVDVNREMIEMVEWCKENPSKAKSKSLWRKFIRGWLQRQNEKLTNRSAYQSTKDKQVISRHTGFQKDNRPRNPNRTLDLRVEQ